MDSATFLGLSRQSDNQFQLEVTPRNVGGRRGGLFGGAGLAASVLAMQQASGRTPVWATTQFARLLPAGSMLDLRVEIPMEGYAVSQARVVGTNDGQEILAGSGAFGTRTERVAAMWDTMPQCLPPQDCEEVVRIVDAESVHKHTETRMGRGMFGFTGTGQPSGDNRSLVWVRFLEVNLDAGSLALAADYMASSVGNAVQQLVMCTSLDNTIRYANPIVDNQPGSWILMDNRVDFVGNGFATGQSLMWSQTGTLLAIASQSMTVVPQETNDTSPKS